MFKSFGLQVFTFHGGAASAPTNELALEVPCIVNILRLYCLCNIFNADETALFFQLPPDCGLATHQMPGVKADRTRLAYLFCANMDGSEKREPLIIGCAQQPRCFGNSSASDLGYYDFWNSTAWMVQSIWQRFLSDLNEDMKSQGQHILLLIDSAPLHRHEDSSYSNIRIEFLPPNIISWIQPLDAGIIRCFKSHYRNGFVRLAIQQDAAGVQNIYNITQLQAMQLASAASSSVSSTTISNCWRHTGLRLDTSSAEAAASNLESTTLRNESEGLNAQVQQRLNLAHPAFQRMLTLLGGPAATEHEVSEEEVVARIEETHIEAVARSLRRSTSQYLGERVADRHPL